LVRRLGVGLAPSFVRLIALSSIRLVSCSIRWGRSLAIGFCPLLLGFTLRHWVLPFVIGLYPSLLGSTLRRWVLPCVLRLYPSSLGFTPRHWVLPLVVGLYPSLLGSTLCHWVLLLVVGFCPLSLGSTLHCWVLPSIVGFYPPSLGSALRRWALHSTAGFYPLPLGSTLRVASAPSSSSSCCPPILLVMRSMLYACPSTLRHIWWTYALSFRSMLYRVTLRFVVRPYAMSCRGTIWLSSKSLGSFAWSLSHGIVIVAVAVAGGRCSVHLNLISGRLRREGWEKMNHDFHRGSF